jgi:hypothetical protein
VLLQVSGLLSSTQAWPLSAMRIAVGVAALAFVVVLVRCRPRQ